MTLEISKNQKSRQVSLTVIHAAFLTFYYSVTYASYSLSDNKSSSSASSDGSTTIIQACSYGESFTYSGLSSISSFTSTTVPLTGAYNSDTVLTDSTLPNGSSTSIVSPTSGNSTNTISPSSDCAKSVIPIRKSLPSRRTHSCSSEYNKSFGKFISFASKVIIFISNFVENLLL